MAFIFPDTCTQEVAEDQDKVQIEACLSSYGGSDKEFLEAFLLNKNDKDELYQKASTLLFLITINEELNQLKQHFEKIDNAYNIISIDKIEEIVKNYLKIVKKYVFQARDEEFKLQLNKIEQLLEYLKNEKNENDLTTLTNEIQDSFQALCSKINDLIKNTKLKKIEKNLS